MKRFYFLLLFIFFASAIFSQVSRPASAFTPGNIVIYRTGDGSIALSANAAPVFLDEYTAAGAFVQSIAMPVAVSGSNQILTAEGTTQGTQEGMITLSADGQWLVLTGYNAAPGTASVRTTTSAAVPRTIGLVNYNGVINTSTALTDLCSGSTVRGAASTNGIDLWAIGIGTGTTTGAHYTTVGSATSVQIQNSAQLKALQITNGQLYTTSGAGTFRIATIGTGTPTTAGQTITALPGTPTSGGSPFQFVFADLNPGIAGPDVLYVADETIGLRKYYFDGTTWALNGIVGSTTEDYRGLTCSVSGTIVTLYFTGFRLSAGGGQLFSLVDASGWGPTGTLGGTPTLLVTAATNTALQGVALAPSVACTSASINVHPSSTSICSGNTSILSVTASGSPTLNYQWYQGTVPDQSNPVGTNSNSFTTPSLIAATNYWVKVTNGCGTVNSNTATVGIYTSATWTGSINNDFNLAGNWNTNCVPGVNMDIIIPSGTPTLTGGSASVRNVTLQAGATLNLNDGAVLHVKGDFMNDGTVVSGGSPADGKTVFDGTVTQNMSGAGIFSYVEINNSIDVFVLSSMSVRSINALFGSKFTVNPSVVLTVLQ